jgi:E3 ubiquitin-protein ligase TRIP12
MTATDSSAEKSLLDLFGLTVEDLLIGSTALQSRVFCLQLGTERKAVGVSTDTSAPASSVASAILPHNGTAVDELLAVLHRAPLARTAPAAIHMRDLLVLLRLLNDVGRAVDPRVLGAVPVEECANSRLSKQLQQQFRNARDVLTPPFWVEEVTRLCPFLLPLSQRMSLFSLRSFGIIKCLQGVQELHGGPLYARGMAALGSRFQVHKSRASVSRAHVLESAMKLMERLELMRSTVVGVQFSHETGHGLGPTIEFFTLVCREVQRKSLQAWRDAAHGEEGEFVSAPVVRST